MRLDVLSLLPVVFAIVINLAGGVTPHSACQSAFAQEVRSSAASSPWPNWMGPNFDGISDESGWSTKWPDEGLSTLWTAELGIGFSSLSIVDGKLYTMGNADGIESVYCFDANDGQLIWKHSYPCELIAVLYEGGPGSTPTVDGDHVYAVSKEGQLMCLDRFKGDIVWEQSLQKLLGVHLPEWGFNASPTIFDGNVLVEVGRLASLNKLTGELNWQSDLHASGYGSVRVLQQSATTDQESDLLVTLDCDAIRINAASDGKEIVAEPWKSPFRTNSTTPILSDDTIFISTGYNVGCGLFRFDGSTLSEVYANKEMRNHFNNCILYDGYLYGFDGNSNLGRVVTLKCMKLSDGSVAWEHRGYGCGSLMIADKKLIVLSDDGLLVVADASREGFQKLAEAQILEGRCWTIPLLHNRRVYARNAKGKLVCVQLP
ncbi:MAG: PQQ-binding-like beta-propeller repeat protein [Pirellulaceae bacterium]